MNIVELRLQTLNLAAQREFDTDVLQLRPLETTGQRVAFQAGHTQLEFEPAPAGRNNVYHFAFNIPENQLRQARAWLASRVAEANRELVLSGRKRHRVRMLVDFPREPDAWPNERSFLMDRPTFSEERDSSGSGPVDPGLQDPTLHTSNLLHLRPGNRG